MKSFGLLLFTLFAMVSSDPVSGADIKKFSEATEADPRLHADGPGWALNKANITDPARPRVLLIGDSILSGYHKDVIAALEGKACVDVWINPHWQREKTNKLLSEVLEHGPYDVVHANMGLHGWQAGRIKEGTFEPLTKEYINVIKIKLPKARIIWANTTPVLLEGDVKVLDPEINANIIEQNRMAAKVMKEMDVPVNDFYSMLVDKLELANGGRDKWHWTKPASKMLAGMVVLSVNQALQMKPKD